LESGIVTGCTISVILFVNLIIKAGETALTEVQDKEVWLPCCTEGEDFLTVPTENPG